MQCLSLGQSDFVPAALVPDYRSVVIIYNYTNTSGQPIVGAQYIVNRDGTVDPASTLTNPPFELSLNVTTADPNTGLAVIPPVDPTFVDPTSTPLSSDFFQNVPATGGPKTYIRFRVTLDDPSNPSFPQTKVQIDSVVIAVNSSTP